MSGRLAGMGIVITRPREAAEALAAELAREGARPIVFPALAVEPVEDSPALEAALAALARSSLAIFVSANAVAAGVPRVLRRGPWPAQVAVAAVGDATAAALRGAGFAGVLSPGERQDSEGLLALPRLQAVQGQRITIFRGVGGREQLRAGLEARGATVAYAECYRRGPVQADATALLAAWDRGEVHAVSALSAETLDNFVAMLGEGAAPRLARATLVVPHRAIAAHARRHGFGRVVLAGAGADGIANALSPITP